MREKNWSKKSRATAPLSQLNIISSRKESVSSSALLALLEFPLKRICLLITVKDKEAQSISSLASLL